MVLSICENRFPLSGSPSTCALDVGIIPIPSILVVPALLALFLYRSRLSSSSSSSPSTRLTISKPLLQRWTYITYLVLIACGFGMRVLEIVRLIVAKQGLGLLPLGLISIVLVFAAVMWKGQKRGPAIAWVIFFYWVLSTITLIPKVARLEQLLQVHKALGSGYPSSDWLLDNAVLLGLLVYFTIYEGVHLFMSIKVAREDDDEYPPKAGRVAFGHQRVGSPDQKTWLQHAA